MTGRRLLAVVEKYTKYIRISILPDSWKRNLILRSISIRSQGYPRHEIPVPEISEISVLEISDISVPEICVTDAIPER